MNATEPIDDKSLLVQVPHGTKPLPESVLTQIYVTYGATMS